MVRYTISVSGNQEGLQIFLAHASDILQGIYNTCRISPIVEEEIMGLDVSSDLEFNFSLNDIWGYRLVSWDPLMKYIASQYVEPDMPDDLLREFMNTVLVKCTEEEHYENLRRLLNYCYRLNLMAFPEEIVPELAVPVVSEQYGVVGTAGELSKAEVINYYLRQMSIKTTLP